MEASRPIHVVVSLGTGRVPVKAVDVCDVYRPEGIFDVAKVVFGAKNLAELFVDQVRTRFTDLCLSLFIFVIGRPLGPAVSSFHCCLFCACTYTGTVGKTSGQQYAMFATVSEVAVT